MTTRVPLEEVAGRARFDLTYKRSRKRRKMHAAGIDGPDIPNSYHWARKAGADMGDGTDWPDAPGDWCSDGPDWDNEAQTWTGTPDEWFAFWLSCAVGEATHEALEWLWVDGKPLLDPHGEHEAEVFRIVGRCADELAALAGLNVRAESGATE